MLICANPHDIQTIFTQGGVFAYPTEAVFGLGCDPQNEQAVMRLLAIKQRPVSKGLILVAADFSHVEHYLKPLNAAQQALTTPSETTYIYPAKATTPKWLTGDFESLAVRISKHPVVRELCTVLDSALVSTSANLSGEQPAKTTQEVEQSLANRIAAIVDGEVGGLAKPTEIRDSISNKTIRK